MARNIKNRGLTNKVLEVILSDTRKVWSTEQVMDRLGGNTERGAVQGALSYLKQQGHITSPKWSFWQAPIINPNTSATHVITEDDRIQAAIEALLPAKKMTTKNLFAIATWIEATKKMLRDCE